MVVVDGAGGGEELKEKCWLGGWREGWESWGGPLEGVEGDGWVGDFEARCADGGGGGAPEEDEMSL